MRGFHPQTKSPAGARGFRPAMAAALAQAQNQAPDSIPAMVKPGEFVLPPDTVHAMGGAHALQGVVNATHTPVRGFAPKARPEEPRQFFANGGLVEDENPKRPNSFGDAAAAAQNAGVTQVGGLANNGGADAARFAQVPAPIGAQPNRTPAPAPLGEPGATSAGRGFAPTRIAAQPAAGDSAGAGAGRGFVNPASAEPQERGIVGFKPGTPDAAKPPRGFAPQAEPSTTQPREVVPGVYNHGRGQYSDDPNGMNMPKGFTGRPSAQNDAILQRMSDQSQAESMARVGAGQYAAEVQRAKNINADEAARNNSVGARMQRLADPFTAEGRAMRNLQMNIDSSLDRKGRPTADTAALVAQSKAMSDGYLAEPNQQRTIEAGLEREGMQQAGETQRSRLQQALADIRERRTAQHQDNQDGIARQRLAIDAARLSRDGVPSGYRPKADGTLEAIPGGPADPTTQAGKKPLNDTQAKALQFGARMQQSGQNLDALASDGVTQPGYIKRMADVVGAGALANWTQNPQQQQVEQSQRDFVNAVLRRESGAAISNSEFDNARQQYFPQPGDSAQVIEQKRRNRELATRGVLAEVPDHQNRMQQVLGATGLAQQGQPRAVARTGTINGRKVVQYADGSIDYAD